MHPALKRTGSGRRHAAAALDQAIAGASNILVAVLAARGLGAAGFGAFSMVFLTYVVASSAVRALVGEPLLVHPEDAQSRPGDAIGSAVVVGLLLAGVMAGAAGVIAWFGAGALARALLALAVFFPFLVLQDLGRYLGFASGRPERALRLDVSWLVIMVVGVVALARLSTPTLTTMTLAWVLAGAIPGVTVLGGPARTRWRFSLTWVREKWSFSWRYLVSFLSSQGSVLLASFALSGIAGAAALGSVRGAQILIRPFMTLHIAAMASNVSHIAGGRAGVRQVRSAALRISTVMTALAAANFAALLLVPDWLGRLVLGATWEGAQHLLVPAGLQIMLFGIWTGARVGLLGLRAVSTTVALDATFVPVTLVIGLVGAWLGGAAGFYWGGVLLQAMIAGAWWTNLWWRAIREQPSPVLQELPD